MTLAVGEISERVTTHPTLARALDDASEVQAFQTVSWDREGQVKGEEAEDIGERVAAWRRFVRGGANRRRRPVGGQRGDSFLSAALARAGWVEATTINGKKILVSPEKQRHYRQGRERILRRAADCDPDVDPPSKRNFGNNAVPGVARNLWQYKPEVLPENPTGITSVSVEAGPGRPVGAVHEPARVRHGGLRRAVRGIDPAKSKGMGGELCFVPTCTGPCGKGYAWGGGEMCEGGRRRHRHRRPARGARLLCRAEPTIQRPWARISTPIVRTAHACPRSSRRPRRCFTRRWPTSARTSSRRGSGGAP